MRGNPNKKVRYDHSKVLTTWFVANSEDLNWIQITPIKISSLNASNAFNTFCQTCATQ